MQRQKRHIARSCEVAFVMVADRIHKVGVFHSERCRTLIHHCNKSVNTAAGIFRNNICRVGC